MVTPGLNPGTLYKNQGGMPKFNILAHRLGFRTDGEGAVKQLYAFITDGRQQRRHGGFWQQALAAPCQGRVR